MVFEDVNTRNGFFHLNSGGVQRFPVSVEKVCSEKATDISWCRPVHGDGAWIQSATANAEVALQRIHVSKDRFSVCSAGVRKPVI